METLYLDWWGDWNSKLQRKNKVGQNRQKYT